MNEGMEGIPQTALVPNPSTELTATSPPSPTESLSKPEIQASQSSDSKPGFFRGLVDKWAQKLWGDKPESYSLQVIDQKLLEKQLSRRKFLQAAAAGAGLVVAAPAITAIEKIAAKTPELVPIADRVLPEQASLLLDMEPVLDSAIDLASDAVEKIYSTKYLNEPHMHEPNSEQTPLLNLLKEAVQKTRENNPDISITYSPSKADVEASRGFSFHQMLDNLGDRGFTISRIVKNMTTFDRGYDDDRWNFVESIKNNIQGSPNFSAKAKLSLKSSFEGFNSDQSIVELTTQDGESITSMVDPNKKESGLANQPLNEVVMNLLSKWDNGEQVTATSILADRIVANNGELTRALQDTALLLKIMARNDPREYYMFIDDIGGMHAHNIVVRFGKGLKDQFSTYNGSWGLENPDPTRDDPNKNIANREGIPYHNFNIVALLSHFDTRFVKAMTVSQLTAWYHSQGELKAMSNLGVLQDLNNISSYLGEFSPAPIQETTPTT